MSNCFPLWKWLWVQDVFRDPKLPLGAKSVALILMTHHNTKTGDLYPSQQTIADYLGMTTRRVRTGLTNLKAAGLVAAKRTAIGGLLRYTLMKPEGSGRPLRAEEIGSSVRKPASDKFMNQPKKRTIELRERDAMIEIPLQRKKLKSDAGRNFASSNIESKNIIRRDPAASKTITSIRYFYVEKDEGNCIAGWASWVDANTEHEFDALLPLLLKNGSYAFPSRFPSEDPNEVARYIQFFDAVMASNGKILG